jgi:hypothetical protein
MFGIPCPGVNPPWNPKWGKSQVMMITAISITRLPIWNHSSVLNLLLNSPSSFLNSPIELSNSVFRSSIAFSLVYPSLLSKFSGRGHMPLCVLPIPFTC